jgi:hypothetical protein
MKKIGWLLFSAIVLGLIVYFIVIPFEFKVKFQANTTPGDVIATIRIWTRSLEGSQVIAADSSRGLKQRIAWGKRVYEYNWEFVSVNDSVTNVEIKISEPGHSFWNKLLVPVSEPAIESDAASIGRTFYDILKAHLKKTRVKIKGEVETPETFCVCSTMETDQPGKANGMMKDFPLLTSFITDHGLKPNGLPLIKILTWDQNQGQIKFDFCFPIVRTDSLPVVAELHYKNFKKQKALQAEYRGNYITSDRAWYELLAFAKAEGYKNVELPVEYFHDNPNLGLNENEWKTDVYLPVGKE